MLQRAIHDYKVLFGLLHNFPRTCKQSTVVSHKIILLSDVIGYAEFYGILPSIAGTIASEPLTIDVTGKMRRWSSCFAWL